MAGDPSVVADQKEVGPSVVAGQMVVDPSVVAAVVVAVVAGQTQIHFEMAAG